MAFIRKELKRGTGPTGTYDAICENATDFDTEGGLPLWAAGSLVICMNLDGDNKATLHIKLSSGAWEEVVA